MHLIEDRVDTATRCVACGAVHTRGRMVRNADDHREWWCDLGCAADYSFGKRAPVPGAAEG